MFITYKQVKDYVNTAQPGTVVGACGNPGACLIAEAVQQKYPAYTVEVLLAAGIVVIDAARIPPYWETVTTGDDGERLYRLAKDFDNLGSYGEEVTREDALELFLND